MKTYEPTDTEIVMDILMEEGRADETGCEAGERDEEDLAIRSTEPPEDPIAYAQECENMG